MNEVKKVKPVRRYECWRLHCKKELVLQLKAICERLNISRRAFVDDLVTFGIHAANTSCGRVTVLEMLQEAARKGEADECEG